MAESAEQDTEEGSPPVQTTTKVGKSTSDGDDDLCFIGPGVSLKALVESFAPVDSIDTKTAIGKSVAPQDVWVDKETRAKRGVPDFSAGITEEISSGVTEEKPPLTPTVSVTTLAKSIDKLTDVLVQMQDMRGEIEKMNGVCASLSERMEHIERRQVEAYQCRAHAPLYHDRLTHQSCMEHYNPFEDDPQDESM